MSRTVILYRQANERVVSLESVANNCTLLNTELKYLRKNYLFEKNLSFFERISVYKVIENWWSMAAMLQVFNDHTVCHASTPMTS